VRVFADTSALFSVIIANDERHDEAAALWNRLLDRGDILFTTSYVIVEMYTLLQSRSGMAAARAFSERVVPYLSVVWMDEALHERAVVTFLATGERRLSLVDCASFTVCREFGVDRVFAFDRHFERMGFRLLDRSLDLGPSSAGQT
jgi:predicted nucleic acid-binding protein